MIGGPDPKQAGGTQHADTLELRERRPRLLARRLRALKRPRFGRPGTKSSLPLMPRVFAVLAAVLLVGSVALASLQPADTSLIQAIHALNGDAPEHFQRFVIGSLGHGFWEAVVLPVLVRPVWMIPVCLGLICIGGAVTAMTQASPRTKQRRS